MSLFYETKPVERTQYEVKIDKASNTRYVFNMSNENAATLVLEEDDFTEWLENHNLINSLEKPKQKRGPRKAAVTANPALTLAGKPRQKPGRKPKGENGTSDNQSANGTQSPAAPLETPPGYYATR
jgi:hypothetical protein